jgi:hypothetical protein
MKERKLLPKLETMTRILHNSLCFDWTIDRWAQGFFTLEKAFKKAD